MTKTVAVLGSTGSIGRQTLQVVQELGLTVAALTANRQVDLLEQQVIDQRLENQELADAIEHSDDPEMQERVAREKGYVKQNEIIYYDVAN